MHFKRFEAIVEHVFSTFLGGYPREFFFKFHTFSLGGSEPCVEFSTLFDGFPKNLDVLFTKHSFSTTNVACRPWPSDLQSPCPGSPHWQLQITGGLQLPREPRLQPAHQVTQPCIKDKATLLVIYLWWGWNGASRVAQHSYSIRDKILFFIFILYDLPLTWRYTKLPINNDLFANKMS